MICAQICFLMALRSNQLNFVIPFFYSTLIFVLLYDYLIFRELPDFFKSFWFIINYNWRSIFVFKRN